MRLERVSKPKRLEEPKHGYEGIENGGEVYGNYKENDLHKSAEELLDFLSSIEHLDEFSQNKGPVSEEDQELDEIMRKFDSFDTIERRGRSR